MDSTVRHNCAEDDKYVHQARQEMDKNVQRERDVMDEKVKQERATMDQRLKHFHEDIDRKLQHERNDMDRSIQLERGKMEVNIMQAREAMDHKLQQERTDMDYKAKMEKIRMEANLMQDRASRKTKAEQPQSDIPPRKQSVSSPPPRPVVVMEFVVHVDYELSHIPQAYLNDRPGSITFVEPNKVEWWVMVDVLTDFGYKGNADMYYIKPGCLPPEGMVLISSQDDIDKMMQTHEGIKKLELYIVKNYPFSDDNDDESPQQDMYEQNMDSCDFDDRDKRYSDEDGSSPRMKKRALNNAKKELTFGSSDEPL